HPLGVSGRRSQPSSQLGATSKPGPLGPGQVDESTLRATVADLVPPGRRATAYGLFAAVIGSAMLLGGVLAGALYAYSIPVLIGVTVAVQVLALVLLAATRSRRT
ncbi:hypothetical protein ACFYRV_07665, partial [Streptomyces scopuliridis]